MGVDVSVAMLEEAMRNCEQRGITNAEFALSDDALSTVAGQVDLVHSAITLQHVEVERGRAFFSRLLAWAIGTSTEAAHPGSRSARTSIACADWNTMLRTPG